MGSQLWVKMHILLLHAPTFRQQQRHFTTQLKGSSPVKTPNHHEYIME